MFTRNFSFLLVVLVAAVQFVSCEKACIQESIVPTTPTSTAEVSTQQINERGFQILNAISCGEIRGNVLTTYGNQTKLNEFPFMALLKYDTDYIYGCAGTLITNRFVLAAAQCWIASRHSPIAVRLGEHDLSRDEDCAEQGKGTFCNPPVEDYGIDELIAHPLYRRGKIDHDIGLIRLDRDVTFKVHIQPICLPVHEDSRKLANALSYIIPGWGFRHHRNTLSAPTILLKAVIPHRQREFCQNIFTRYNITDDLICAGGDSLEDSCIDESGGPLFFQSLYNRSLRYVQYGIISSGATKCPTMYPFVSTKIISYLPWLTNAIAQNESI